MESRPAPDGAFSCADHRRCIESALDRAATVCEKRGVRLTHLRRRVLELVWSGHKPLGAYELLETLRRERQGAAPPTVYRALEFLLEQGLAHRIESLNSFVGCVMPGTSHVCQFLICRGCGVAAEISDGRIEEAIGTSAAEAGFAVSRRTIEVEGLCPYCQVDGGGVDG